MGRGSMLKIFSLVLHIKLLYIQPCHTTKSFNSISRIIDSNTYFHSNHSHNQIIVLMETSKLQQIEIHVKQKAIRLCMNYFRHAKRRNCSENTNRDAQKTTVIIQLILSLTFTINHTNVIITHNFPCPNYNDL